jgi:hypothetical protein
VRTVAYVTTTAGIVSLVYAQGEVSDPVRSERSAVGRRCSLGTSYIIDVFAPLSITILPLVDRFHDVYLGFQKDVGECRSRWTPAYARRRRDDGERASGLADSGDVWRGRGGKAVGMPMRDVQGEVIERASPRISAADYRLWTADPRVSYG